MTHNVPDDYRIQSVERTGYPADCPEPVMLCPNCGIELYGGSRIYRRNGQVIGCEDCINAGYAEDEL